MFIFQFSPWNFRILQNHPWDLILLPLSTEKQGLRFRRRLASPPNFPARWLPHADSTRRVGKLRHLFLVIYSGILCILEDPIKDGFGFAHSFVQEGSPRGKVLYVHSLGYNEPRLLLEILPCVDQKKELLYKV